MIVSFAGSIFMTTGAQALDSSAASVITFNASNQVNIQNVDNITFDDVADDISVDVVKTDNVCVWSRSGAYTITATTGNSAYTLIGPTTNDVSYAVGWDDGTGTFATSLAYGTTSATINGTAMNGANCASGDNAAFRLTFAAAGLQAAEVGAHSDTLTFTIATP